MFFTICSFFVAYSHIILEPSVLARSIKLTILKIGQSMSTERVAKRKRSKNITNSGISAFILKVCCRESQSLYNSFDGTWLPLVYFTRNSRTKELQLVCLWLVADGRSAIARWALPPQAQSCIYATGRIFNFKFKSLLRFAQTAAACVVRDY